VNPGKAFCVILLSVAAAQAWHQVGHQIVAAICYDNLTDKARARVDALVRAHPDYEHFAAGAKGSRREIARRAFINTAAWADDIKGDERFYDDTRRDAVATPVRPGFPDMKRRTNWHYINLAFSPDGTAFPEPPEVNAVTQVHFMIASLGQKASPGALRDPVYLLPWFTHVAGDLHQPMHAATRWHAKQVDPKTNKPWGDLGGNTVIVDGYTNLHSVWDELLGVTEDWVYIEWMAQRLQRNQARESKPVVDPAAWAQESHLLAKSEAYAFGPEVGSRENPFRRTPGYRQNAIRIAHKQAALAGYRMAAVLNEKLR
jgi:hypothetical protein